MLQRYYDRDAVDVISVSGCMRGGELLALHHSRKLTQAPARLGVGSMFESVPPQPFTDAAVDVVRPCSDPGCSSSKCSSSGRRASTTPSTSTRVGSGR